MLSRCHVQLFYEPMDCSPPGSSVRVTSQARVLEWVDISFFRGSSQSRDQICISCIDRQILCHWTTQEALLGTCVIITQCYDIKQGRGVMEFIWAFIQIQVWMSGHEKEIVDENVHEWKKWYFLNFIFLNFKIILFATLHSTALWSRCHYLIS